MHHSRTRALVRCALFAALTAAGALVHIQLFQATITLQFFFTMLSGLLLGARLGALSQALYVFLGLAGLPVFALGGGAGYLFHPTFGFVLGLVPAAWVVGTLGKKARSARRIALSCLAGLAVLYAVGLPYLALIVNVYQGGSVGLEALVAAYLLPYLPGDGLKIALVVSVAPRILRALKNS